jgi:predicted membrane protein
MEMLLTIIGLIGVFIALGAYALLSLGKFTRDDKRYYWLNILGTTFIAVSLLVQWNLAAMVSQIIWIVISFVGLYRLRKARSV